MKGRKREKRGTYLAPLSAVASSIVAIYLQTSPPTTSSSSNSQGVSNKSSPSPRSIRQWGTKSSGRCFAAHRQSSSSSTTVTTIISHHSFTIAFLGLKESHKRKTPTRFSSSLGRVLERVKTSCIWSSWHVLGHWSVQPKSVRRTNRGPGHPRAILTWLESPQA